MGVKLNMPNIRKLDAGAVRALKRTADALLTDLKKSQTMPFDTGAMQNRSTFVDDSKAEQGAVYIVSDTAYSRRLYFHPEYNFQTGKNPQAGAEWFDDYISGAKREYAQRLYAKFMRRELQ